MNKKMPSLYISHDEEWGDKTTARLIVHNNMRCAVTFTTTDRHTVIKREGKGLRVYHPASDELEDGELVALQYKINSEKQTWASITYWPYGDTVFSHRLLGGRSAKFIVSLEHVKGKRQIAVPLNYEWETWAASSGIEHLVYLAFSLPDRKNEKRSSR